MTRSKDERDRSRADLLRILEEQGPTPAGDLIATAYGVREVQRGSLYYRQGMTDLNALERQRKVMPGWQDGWLRVWMLADQQSLDELEDAAEVGRLMAGWKPAS